MCELNRSILVINWQLFVFFLFRKDEVSHLRREIVSLKASYEDQIGELEKKLEEGKKVQEMLIIRLNDEQKARYYNYSNIKFLTASWFYVTIKF